MANTSIRMANTLLLTMLLLPLALTAAAAEASSGLVEGFYKERCPRAEEIVKRTVESYVKRAPTLAAPILRMLFHDCFVTGCDASVLVNSTQEFESEKEAIPNKSLRGFHVIDAAKEALERECPGVVSCADVLALAARDAVGVVGGPKWEVATGRRDGERSKKADVSGNIPSPFLELESLKVLFERKGLEVVDLVALSGAHTIGITRCNSVGRRIYNTSDATSGVYLDRHFVSQLKRKCAPSDTSSIVELDPGSFKSFDNHFYVNLLKRRGVFHSDSVLLDEPATRALVQKAAAETHRNGWFFTQFASSMQKMSAIGVLTGTQGNIRRHCALLK